MEGYMNKYHVVTLEVPVDHAGTLVSNIISLKNYQMAELYLMTGAAVTKTSAITLHQGVSVSSCATALAFSRYYEQGCMLDYDTITVSTLPAAAGQTATGASTAVGTVYEDLDGTLVLYNRNAVAFVDNEVLTFSGGKIAAVKGTLYNEDILVPRVATSSTFNITQVLDANKIFMIPVSASMLAAGMDCIEVNGTDLDSPSLMACFAILSEPRYKGVPMQTSIYN
jgi:hypothetical protein